MRSKWYYDSVKLQNKKGMTLIEVIVIMVVLTILLGAVYLVFSQSTSTIMKENSRVEIQQNMRQALQYIQRDLRSADQQSVPSLADGCYTINEINYCLETDGVITRGGQAIAYDIQSFVISSEGSGAFVQMESMPDRYNQSVTIDTQVTLRGERSE